MIFLQFVLGKYTMFNHIKNNKKTGIKNEYTMYYLIELARLKGPDRVIEQCQRLNYYVQLPKEVQQVKLNYTLPDFD